MDFVTKPARFGPALATVLLFVAIGPAGPARAADPEPGSGTPAPASTEAAPDAAKRVVYLPETLKAQIRDGIKEEVLAQAKREGWAAPNALPEWTKRLVFKGDLRFRWERDLFRPGNATGWYFDFNSINGGSGMDVHGTDYTADRYLDVDQNRTRPRLRSRIGLEADLGRGFTSGVRLATGDGSTPVSTNQTLGGNFSKYQIWLDRAALAWSVQGSDGNSKLTAEIGRFENPFLATELIWSENVNLDGLALRGSMTPGEGMTPFLTVGAFPVFTTALDFSSEAADKFRSVDKWLYAAQAGAEWKPGPAMALQLAGAFYYFKNVEGSASSPCATNVKGIGCDSDMTRPSFAQKGNTYRMLRTPSDLALQQELQNPTSAAEYQYFGLATRFRELAATGRLRYEATDWLAVVIDAEYVQNVTFKRSTIAPVAYNNCRTADASGAGCADFFGGSRGYLGRVTVGSPALVKRWDWSVGLTYRYVESDAVVDAFNDSDFGLGGTNLKGFTFGGALAVSENVAASVRWMSADVVAGPQFSVDVLQIDLSARY
jgi:hypothetical protein